MRWLTGATGGALDTIDPAIRQQIDNAFAGLMNKRAQAVMVASDAFFFGQRQRIAEIALA